MNRQRRILVVDDNQNMARTLAMILDHKGYATDVAHSGLAARARIAQAAFDCVVSDIKMSEMNGVELYRAVKADRPSLPFVLITAYATGRLVEQGLQEGAITVLIKPFDVEQLLSILDRACGSDSNAG